MAKLKYILAALTAVVIWGFFSIPLRNLKHYPAEQIMQYRIVVSLFFTWLFLLLFRLKKIKEDILHVKSLSPLNKSNLGYLTLLSGILITGNWYTFIYAINNVSLKSAAFAYMVCPLITAFGGFFILKEKATSVKIAGMCLALLSILFLAQGSLIEVFWSVLIASLYAFYLIIQRVVGKIDRLLMLGVQLLISVILMLPFFLYHHYRFPGETVFWYNIILISVVFTIIPLFLSLYSLNGISSSTLGILIYINPIIAFTIAFFYFDEQVSMLQIVAYMVLFIAVIIFNWDIVRSVLNKQALIQQEE